MDRASVNTLARGHTAASHGSGQVVFLNELISVKIHFFFTVLSTTPKSKHCPASKESSGRLLQLPFLFPASPCVGFISNELYRI